MKKYSVYLLAVLLLSLVIWGIVMLRSPETLLIEEVTVQGSFVHLTREGLREIVTPYVSKGFFAIDVDGLRKALEELPWVYQASVRRIWPATISIQITEQQPVARWGSSYLINGDGKLFEANNANVLEKLPELDGPNTRVEEVLEIYHQMNDILRPLGIQASRVRVNERNAWEVGLSNGINLLIGRKTTLERLQRFVRTYHQVVGSRGDEVAYIDLRYTNGLAVKWKQT